jgi:hypothetical protein
MADYDTIIVGAGTSALTYLYYALQTKDIPGKTLVVGEDGLWQKGKIAKFEAHEMGQPEDLLYPANAQRGAVEVPDPVPQDEDAPSGMQGRVPCKPASAVPVAPQSSVKDAKG